MSKLPSSRPASPTPDDSAPKGKDGSPSAAASTSTHVPAPAKKSRQPRKFAAPSSASVDSVPSMLKLVANAGVSTLEYHELSRYKPSFIACAAVISEMNDIMMTTHRFTQGAPNWNPYVSLAFLGNAFIVQCLRAESTVAILPQHEQWILDSFTQSIQLETIMIPGPIVPFFQAITASCAPLENYGNVTPSVLDITSGCNQNNDYLPTNRWNRILPDIPMYIDCLRRFQKLTAMSQEGLTHIHNQLDHFYQRIMHQVASANLPAADHMCAPGLPVRPYLNYGASTAADHVSMYDLPTPLDSSGTDTVDLTLVQYMRLFDQPTATNVVYHTWFSQAATVMNRFSQFFEGSVPLSAIAATGIGSALVVTEYQVNPALRNPYAFVTSTYVAAAGTAAAPTPASGKKAHYVRYPITSLSCSIKHNDPDAEVIAEQLGMLAQTNIKTTNMGLTVPTHAQLRTGPVWNLPECRSSSVYDIVPGLASRIVTDYSLDQRAKRT